MVGFPIDELARHLRVDVGRAVVDKTGLTGTFDINLETELQSVPEALLLPQPEQPPIPREGLTLFTALQEQLGLKLVSERGPIQVLVIDHVEHLTPN